MVGSRDEAWEVLPMPVFARETRAKVGTDPAERQLRVDLAAAFRWTARLGWHEAVANHFSVAVSADGRRIVFDEATQTIEVRTLRNFLPSAAAR